MYWYPTAHRGSLSAWSTKHLKFSTKESKEVFVMSRWPAAWPRRVSPEAIGLARAYSFATFCRGRGRQAFPRAACVMLSIPVFLGGAVASRVCQSCGTGPPPYARRRARSEPSLLSVVERSPLGKSVLRFSSKGKINNRPPFCESIIR